MIEHDSGAGDALALPTRPPPPPPGPPAPAARGGLAGAATLARRSPAAAPIAPDDEHTSDLVVLAWSTTDENQALSPILALDQLSTPGQA